MEIQDLIDRRIELKAQEEKIKEELSRIDDQIKDQYEPGAVLLGSQGYGYKLSVSKKRTYGDEANRVAFQVLTEINLLEPFVKVSGPLMEKLAKAGTLPYAALDVINQAAEEAEVQSLRPYTPQEAKVVA